MKSSLKEDTWKYCFCSENTVTLSVDGNTKIKVEKEFVFPNSSSITK